MFKLYKFLKPYKENAIFDHKYLKRKNHLFFNPYQFYVENTEPTIMNNYCYHNIYILHRINKLLAWREYWDS